MSDNLGRWPSRALILLGAGYACWIIIVLYYTSSVEPSQRILLAGSLLAVGGLVCGMGYLSTIRRRALRSRQDSLQRMLDKRRRERGN